MEAGQLPAGLLPGMEYLPAETLVVQLAARGSDGAVFSRLPDHAGEPLVDTVQYIDLSKAHLTNLGPPAVPADPAAESRAFLQDQYPRWQAVRQRHGLTEDHQVARLLLDVYESSLQARRRGRPKAEDEEEIGDEDRTVVHCEIGDTTGTIAGGGIKPRRKWPASRPRAISAQSDRPCPRSRKPPGWHQEPAPIPPPDSADVDCSGSEDTPTDDPTERGAKLFTFPPVENQLLCYFRCGLCEKTGFEDVETYFDHLWRAHTEFHMVGGRINRIPIRLRPQLFVMCALCGFNNKGSNGDCHMYLTQQHLPEHLEVLTDRPRLQCDLCETGFSELGALALHAIDEQHENAAHRCSECGVEIEGTRNYISHLQLHYLSRPFQCYFCMEMFGSEASCIAHIKRHHVNDYSVHKCSSCGYVTALFHDFLLHIRSHTQLNRFVCHICGIVFLAKSSLKDHLRTHVDSKFQCEQCNRVFTHPQTLRRHVLNAHNRPEKCTCNVCGRQFGSAYSVKRHQMLHTGEKPFQCDKCGRGFVQKVDLRVHYSRCKFRDVSTSEVLQDVERKPVQYMEDIGGLK